VKLSGEGKEGRAGNREILLCYSPALKQKISPYFYGQENHHLQYLILSKYNLCMYENLLFYKQKAKCRQHFSEVNFDFKTHTHTHTNQAET
jgi:hypothetical protein